MKKIISILLCIHFALPHTALANQFMDDAKKLVAEYDRAAENVVDAKINNDVHQSLILSLNQLAKLKESDDRIKEFADIMKYLEASFANFLENPNEDIELTQEYVQRAILAYTLLYNESISASWTPLYADQQYASVPGLIKQGLVHLKEKCAAGDWPTEYPLAIQMGDALPKFEYDYSVYLGNGSQLPHANFSPHNYVEDNKTQKFLMQSAGTAFSITGAYAAPGMVHGLTGYGAAGATTGFSGTMIAAFPYAAAALVAVAAITSISASRKREKLAKQRLAADYYKFNNTRRSIWLKEEYKERCADVVKLTEPLLKDVTYIQLKNSEPEAVKKYYSADLKSLKAASESFVAYEDAKCKKELSSLYFNNQCLRAEQAKTGKENDSENKTAPPCMIENNIVRNMRKNCELSEENKKLKINWDDIDKAIAKFESGDVSENVALDYATKHIRYITRNMFVENYSAFQNNIRQYVGNGVYQSRQKALQRLQKLIAVYRKSKFAQETQLIETDLELFKQYSELKAQHLHLVGQAIQVIFGKVTPSDFQKNLKSFREDLEPFHDKYLYVSNVRDLMNLLMQLEKSMGLTLQPAS